MTTVYLVEALAISCPQCGEKRTIPGGRWSALSLSEREHMRTQGIGRRCLADGTCNACYRRLRRTGMLVISTRTHEPTEAALSAVAEGVADCIEWTGAINGGYGRRGTRHAHRLIYELTVGPIPDGMELDHLCRNTSCVNPAHLEPVTHRVNTLRGTSPSANNARKTHCKRGHEFTPENTFNYAVGRVCRTCALASARRRYRSKRLAQEVAS